MAGDADTSPTPVDAKPRVFSGIQPTGGRRSATTAGASASTPGRRRRTTRSSASSTCTRSRSSTTRRSCASRRSTSRRCSSRPASTPSARPSSARATSSAHAEAAWLLSAVAELRRVGPHDAVQGEVRRHDFVSAGLFTYPVLMAGDILLYQTDLVPIGDDQRQHLELARDVAERFNHRYGETFRVPRGRSPRWAGGSWTCRSPTSKMSTTLSRRAGRRLPDRLARRDPQEVQVGRDGLRPRDPPRPGDRSPASRTSSRS